MNCEQFRSIRNRYLAGSITAAEEEAVESHLAQCADCRGLIDEEMDRIERAVRLTSRNGGNQATGLDDKRQQNILRRAKYKNRFSIAIFLLILFIFLNTAGVILSSLYYTWGEEDSRLFKTQKTAALLTEFTFPNVTVPAPSSPFPVGLTGAGWGHSSLEIKPYFVAQSNYAMHKRIGKKDYGIGHLNINQLLSAMNVNWQWQDGSFQDYLFFIHPEQLDNIEFTETRIHLRNNAQPVWEALQALPEGTVAEMSLSFNRTFTIDEIRHIWADYDMDITWYAVSTGLEVNPQYNHDRRAPLSAFHGVWGLPENSRNILAGNATIKDDAAVLENHLLKSMQFLIQNEAIAKRIFRGEADFLQLPARYEYIQSNGVNVYGVVVTGPSRELFKLQELDFVHSPGLGEVRLWNWFDRSYQGEMY